MLALAIGICALTMLVAIAVAFRNDVIGTLLGDAVALRVRSVDLLAAIAAVLLGVLAVALAGLGGIAWPVGDLNSDIVWLAAIVAASGIGVATLAACVPALLLRRFPLSTLLAEE